MDQLQTVKGFRDFLPSEKRRRDFIEKKVVEVFERFGFEPLETPTIEYASLLLGKYGKEADKLIYSFKDRGGRDLSLKYDQTVPTSRILIQYQNTLSRYFRRYQIQNVFRAEKPQKGRYREFTQCDIDIFGSTSPISDAEIIAATYFAFANVNYPKITLLINDRQILFSSLEKYASDTISVFSIIQSIDKLEKIGTKGVIEELVKKGFTNEKATSALNSIQKAQITENLKVIIQYTTQLGVPKENLLFTPHLARGLDYYTGMIFEVVLDGFETGSLGGGGRYDQLIEKLGGKPIPAVGIAFGFDRMVEAAEQFNLIPSNISSTTVLVTIFNKETAAESFRLARLLRKNKINTEVYPAEDKLDKQLKYADRNNIPNVVILGPEEVNKKMIKLKNMKTGEQKEMTIEQLTEFLSSNYSN